MMIMDIKTWSENHNTSEAIGRAIHKLAGEDEIEVERIWQFPTDQQLSAIWQWSTAGGQVDARKLFWNSRSLAEVML